VQATQALQVRRYVFLNYSFSDTLPRVERARKEAPNFPAFQI